MCILAASAAVPAARAADDVPAAAAANCGTRAPVPAGMTRTFRTLSINSLPDSMPDYAFVERCGPEGILLVQLARTHLSRRCQFEVAVEHGTPQLYAVLAVVARGPVVGTSCTTQQARAARLGEHRVGDVLRVRVFVGDDEFRQCRNQDRHVSSLLGFNGAVQTFRAVRRAAQAPDATSRRRHLPPNTGRIFGHEVEPRSARAVARAANPGLIARRQRENQLERAGSEVIRHLFATLRHRGMMRYPDGTRRVSPSVTEWVTETNGRARLHFRALAGDGRDRDVTRVNTA